MNVSVSTDTWRIVWRKGFVPNLTTEQLKKLREACENDDVTLIQGGTTSPPPLKCVEDWPVEAACAVTYCGWQGDGRSTVGEAEEFFAKKCFEADQSLGEPAACRWFLNWFDDTPRSQMLKELSAEISFNLQERL